MTQALVQNPATSLNGFEIAAIDEIVKEVTQEPARALATFRVTSTWAGAAAAEHRVEGFELGGSGVLRRHVFRSDEPTQFLGADSAPNPQEYLFAALNACMLYGYATKAAYLGIPLERITVETRGTLDVRGAMGLAPVPPGCESLSCIVHVKANASDQRLAELHQEVMRTSPNVFHIISSIRLAPTLVVD